MNQVYVSQMHHKCSIYGIFTYMYIVDFDEFNTMNVGIQTLYQTFPIYAWVFTFTIQQTKLIYV